MKKPLKSRHAIDLTKSEFREMHREFTLDRAGIDVEARTVPLSFASESPVERWFGREILDITPEACDLARLRTGGAVLLNHDWTEHVGVVLTAEVDAGTKKARAVVKFSRSQCGEDCFQDIRDGIRTLISVGYIVRKMVLQSVEGDVETHRVTDWQPFEISVVSVPADISVGIGRSQPAQADPLSAAPLPAPAATITTAQVRTMTPEEIAAQEAVARKDTLATERTRAKDINAAAAQLAGRHPQHAEALRVLAAKCIETGDGVDVFNRSVLADILKSDPAAPGATRQGDALIGMNKNDVKRYSLLRAIRLAMDNKPIDGLERECSDELTKKLERTPKGFFVPDEIIADAFAKKRSQRTLLATNAPDGGYTVAQDLLIEEFVDLLRNSTRVVEAGARVISGLVGDVTIPRQLTGSVAYWVSETGSITQSSPTFGQIVGRPRRIGTSVPYSKQFLAQTSLGAEAFVTNDSDLSIALEIDRVALRGTGGAEPLGIANLAAADRSTSVAFSAAPTWAKYLEFFTSVAGNNALLGSPTYIASVAAAVKAMTIPKFSNTATPIWDNDKVGVFRALWSTNLLTTSTPVANMVIFGDFSQVLILEWAGRDVVVDPYTGKKEGTIEVTIQRLIDVVIRRGKSFAISSDSGAQ